ncbi:MAG: hypothetical protein ACQEQF_12630 [Bacillota bacterium]
MSNLFENNYEAKENGIRETLVLLLHKRFSLDYYVLKNYFEKLEKVELKLIVDNFWSINSFSDLKELITKETKKIPSYVENPRTIADKLKREGFIEGYAEVLINKLEYYYNFDIPEEIEKQIFNADWNQLNEINNKFDKIKYVEDIKKILN